MVLTTLAMMSMLAAPPTLPARYLALGDSYTIGESVPADARWPNRLAAALRASGREIGDPQAYFLPDVTCDFSTAKVEQVGENLVKVSGAKGLPPTDTYKVSATYPEGFRLIASFVIIGIDAARKGERKPGTVAMVFVVR